MAISDLDFPVGVVARSHSDSAQLAQALAENVAGALRDAIDSHGKATLVVPAGVARSLFSRRFRSRPCPGARCW